MNIIIESMPPVNQIKAESVKHNTLFCSFENFVYQLTEILILTTMSEQKGKQDTGKQDTGKQADRDNRANELNPNNPEFRGGSSKYGGDGTQADRDNHSDQLNPNNPEFGGGSKK